MIERRCVCGWLIVGEDAHYVHDDGLCRLCHEREAMKSLRTSVSHVWQEDLEGNIMNPAKEK